jgi:hypothetical protein
LTTTLAIFVPAVSDEEEKAFISLKSALTEERVAKIQEEIQNWQQNNRVSCLNGSTNKIQLKLGNKLILSRTITTLIVL